MPCSHANSRRNRTDGEQGLDRREFLKSALAIGGASAAAAALEVSELTGVASAAHRSVSIADRDNRQHAWAEYLATDARGIVAPPSHHVLLFMNYEGSGTPTEADREEMEGALQQLEKAFEWSNEGLLFTTNYSPVYFDRFSENLPVGVDLRTAQDIIDSVRVGDEDPVAESYELFIDLASDNPSNLLEAEEALWGERSYLNGVRIRDTFEGIFQRPTSYPDRRTGFVGPGEPAEQIDNPDIPEDAPLSLGFQSVMEDNIPSEDDVTMIHNQTLGQEMPPGVFAQGTIQTANNLAVDADSWHDQSLDDQMERMFSPHHDPDSFGPIGNDQTTSGTAELPMRDVTADDDIARRTQEDAETKNLVGHAQKLARARFDLSRRDTDGEDDNIDDTTILRRDFNTTDVAQTDSGLHFLALMRFNSYFEYVREAMNGVGFQSSEEIVTAEDTAIDHEDVDIPIENDGFLDFITTLRRGNFLVPPLHLRSLPPARASYLDITVSPGDGKVEEGTIDTSRSSVAVEVINEVGTVIRPSIAKHLRFGPIDVVNKSGGAKPFHYDRVELGGDFVDDLLLYFHIDETGFEVGDEQARLYAINEDSVPILGDSAVTVV